MRSFFLLRFFRLNSLMALTYSQDTHHSSVEDEFQTGLETSLETHRHGIVRDLEGLSLGRGKGVGSKGKPPGNSKEEVFEAFRLFKTYLDQQGNELKSEFSSVDGKDKPKQPQFKSRLHKIQFAFNHEIVDGLRKKC